MQFNLELILVIGVIFFGLVMLYYFFMGDRISRPIDELEPILLDYSKSFLPFFIILLVIRSFIVEPFRIPSGSMIPTLEVGDFIFVKKYSYALRLPILNTEIITLEKPERGDVAVFRYPVNPGVNYIKRVIGLPGDHIEWTADKKLIINGLTVKTLAINDYNYKDGRGESLVSKQFTETFANNKSHEVINFPDPTKAGHWVVPEGHYFMMGDNRDKSSDSRFWGFVPESHFIGKASLVWMHWNWFDNGDGFQSNRIGTPVN